PKQAFDKALRSDPVSAFGGIIAMTGVVDEAAASAMAELFAEVVMADGFTKEALDIFAGKKNLRVLTMPRATDLPHAKIKSVSGGFLVQSADMARINNHDLEVKAGTNDDEAALADLVFGFRVVKHVTSNGIVLARDGATVGIGGGQTNRVDAVDLAVRRADKSAQIAGEPTSFAKGARLASDAFFPFPDNIERLAEAGVTHVVQPTGSMRDEQVFAKAAECGVTIYGAPSRHFKH
ncbi:MAG TPA: bifunctional phosphoribosylaminoimidazolecarboxamide formyltransferase/inosine monophosphate cyclohydrolase, partial [Alphaproteobacteria bacterium]|nr:bifunctional phosphoribosylaminoimidazolecarboxamide formyltransferase/inosine monophosphate cyclohydrolase [Alphaproteobacteria bacterium]